MRSNRTQNSSKLIFISTTYVYDLTLKHQLYNEEHFNPLKYTPLNNERSEISYEDGKRSSENYLERQYKKKSALYFEVSYNTWLGRLYRPDKLF